MALACFVMQVRAFPRFTNRQLGSLEMCCRARSEKILGGQAVSAPVRYNSAEVSLVDDKGLIKTSACKLETGKLMLGL